MYHYHGSKTPPEIVLKEGLKPAPIAEIVRKAKKDFGIGSEIDGALVGDINRKLRCLYVYFDSDKGVAYYYASMGANFENNIRIEICSYLGLKFVRSKEPGFLYSIALEGFPSGEIKLAHVKPSEIMEVEEISTTAKTG